ncbi:phage replication-related protein YjqB (UPF0714/DUF867 family) [Staphylococcus caledonicus]|uniref:poly-gamma-glutamate hydrolase family protein n=1 Tax=Staphylococcus caledonicus TaxID=2741333 RepID=UPI003C2AB7D7
MDKYKSMQELESKTTKNKDWEIIAQDRESEITVLAIHGGGIEPASTELAYIIAEKGNYNYFSFNGIRTKGNNELHVTSTKYDNEIALNMISASDNAIAIHGCLGEESVVYIGGKDLHLKSAIIHELKEIGINVQEASKKMAGLNDQNIVNKTAKNAGVQLELTSALRRSLFKNNQFNYKSRRDQSNWDDMMYKLADAVKEAIDKTT